MPIRRMRTLIPSVTEEASTTRCRVAEEEEEEEFITIGSWRGKHNSLLRGAGAQRRLPDFTRASD